MVTADIKSWGFHKVYGAFSIEKNKLCGYAMLMEKEDYINFSVMKALPECERNGINAAIVSYILESYCYHVYSCYVFLIN